MTQHTQPSEVIIYITHVEADDVYLKIWGQLDKHAATCVEHFIYPLVEKFAQGYGCSSRSRLITGTLCCARFQTDGYYRAKILDIRQDGMIIVQFIDYGNVEALMPNDVHLLENIPGLDPLHNYPPMAVDFTLINVLPVNGIWENRTIEMIRKIICYKEYRAVIHPTMNDRCLIKLWYNNEDFSDLLIREHMALPIVSQDLSRPKQLLQPQIQVYQQSNKSNLNNFVNVPMMQSANSPNVTMQGIFQKATSPGLTQQKSLVASQLPLIQEALVFKSRVLDIGSKYEVLISHVEDGPQKFSVQVQSTTEILNHLMSEINSRPKKPLQEPPLPGSVCLGRYAKDKVLCRAVVMSVMEHKCKLYYVDFGHTEILPYTDIFQLPSEYINPKVLSIRFTLSGLKELNITEEMKDYFKELVWRKLLVLHVRPPEGPPLIQYGDLYDNGVNVKDILKKAFPAPAITVPITTYSYLQLRRMTKDAQEIVHVSFVESCKKFFVQFDSGTKSLESIMFGLAQYVKTASTLDMAQLKNGLPCAALYDSQWYRAQILNINGDKIKVVYVDYGNEEVLPLMSLRMIHDDLVTKLPAQAIRCALNGHEVLLPEQEVANHFERLTLEKRFYMKVVASQSDTLLVDLFEFETMKNVHFQLLNNPFCDKTENSTTNSQNGEIQHSGQTNLNDFQSEDKNKYSKKNNIDSRNRTQNTNSFQENKSNVWKDEWTQEKQYDNRRERANHFQRNGSQNERFTRDEAFNRFSRDNRSYNKYDKTETDVSNRSDARNYRGDKNRFSGSEPRYNRNSSFDKGWKDKDFDTSTKYNDKRGRSNFNRDDREGRRDSSSISNTQTKWNDKDNDRSGYKTFGKFNGDHNTNNKSQNKDNDASNFSCDQTNTYESWDTGNINISDITTDNKVQFSSINITLETVKNCEVVFINNPSDFFIQLSSNYFELELIMNNIAEIYENGGEAMQTSEIQCGTCCVAQYEEDFKWYRALIKSIEGNNVIVEFVDYGNTESLELSKVKVIREEFLKLPMQAIHCKLFGLAEDKGMEDPIFVEKVEGKSLEVEFITEKNGLYEVLLREVLDDESKANYINDEFCTNMDLMRAKNIATNKKVPNTVTKKIDAVPEHASFDSKWQTTLYEAKHDVIVTWFINPNKFYCQVLTEEEKFKAMMNEIQQIYADREPVMHRLEVGMAIIAMFPEDEALYRAEIVSNNMQQGYIVQYIDFGNCATVNQRNIYPVEKRFMQLPKLAVQCSLKDIVSNNNSDWSDVDNDALDNCFNADKYKCIFHNLHDDRYTVSLIHNEEDVGNMLIQRNLAALAPTRTKLTNATEVSNIEIPDTVERVDISLLDGQKLKMRVSSVKSTTLFYVQLPSATKCKNIIDNYMADKNAQVMPRLSSHEMCLGAGCLIDANGTWRRAVVINCSRSIGFDVKFIDTGAYDEILDGTLALPGALAVMQNQALECSLQCVPESLDADKQLKELVEGKEVLIYVEEVNNCRLIVRLYNLSGDGIMNTDKRTLPICPMPILNSTHKVFVSCIYDAKYICLQRHSDYEFASKLLEDLEQYYSNSGRRWNPEDEVEYAMCVVKNTDGRWYRGNVISYTETMVRVRYIDYGSIEETALESVMILEPQFYEPYQLAVNVSLSVSVVGTSTEQEDILKTYLLNKELTAVFYNVHKNWVVDFIDENGEKFSDTLRSLNLVEEVSMISKSLHQMQKILPAIHKFDICVSHVDSPSQFWMQQMDEIAFLDENQEKLQLEVSTFAVMDCIPEEGTLCVAIYSIDNLWYRAEVLDADEDITTVRFIDYGNTDVIDNKTNNIRQMPDSWKTLKRYALKCRLDVIPIDAEDWSESTCERFNNLVTSVDTLQALIVADTVPKRVELFINDKSVSETLVEEKHAIMINAEQAEPVDEIVDLELDPHSAFVCHINSPSEFWIQEEKSVADLEVMTDRFMIADMFPKIDNEEVKAGLLCVAKYPEDGQWYRARVLSHNDETTQVIFVDYGNSSASIEIRALPEDQLNIPPLSRKCCLELPLHVKEWPERACEEFVKLAADGATIFLLDVLEERDTSLVKLTINGRDVADILTSFCEQYSPVIEERLPPLGEENSPNVMISHVNNPSEFWIQAESSISELEAMSDRLRNAASFLTLNTLDVDIICAARYPEDGDWYRAKILACRDEGTEVLYIDYGNSAVTEELKMLPEDIVNIPILSRRCALKKPCHIAAWSENACNKFKELAAEGATMFQFEILDKDNPTHIRLNLNGTDVIRLLLSECEDDLKEHAEKVTEIGYTTIDTEKQDEIIADETANDVEICNIKETAQEPANDVEICNIKETAQEPANDVEICNIKETAQEPVLNQTDSDNNLDCANETNKLEDIIVDEVIDRSFDDSDVNVKYKYTEEQREDPIASCDEIERNIKFDEVSEIATSQCSAEMKETLNSDYAAAICLEKPLPIVTELTVDDIVGNMVRDSYEDPKLQETHDINLLNTNQMQLQSVQDDANEQQELHSQVKIHDCSEENVSETEKISDETIRTIARIYTNSEEVLSAEDMSQDVQIGANSLTKEQILCSETRTSVSELSEPLISTTETCNMSHLSEKQTNLSEQIRTSLKIESDKTDDSEVESTLGEASTASNLNVFSESTRTIITTQSPFMERKSSLSRFRSEDKIVPGCISRGESPDAEAITHPLTPKTSHSEKLVDTLQSGIQKENESLTFSIEGSIPK